MTRVAAILLLIAGVLLTSCGGDTAPTQTPIIIVITATPEPTQTSIPPTATAPPTATTPPTATAVPPTDTPEPTAIPTAAFDASSQTLYSNYGITAVLPGKGWQKPGPLGMGADNGLKGEGMWDSANRYLFAVERTGNDVSNFTIDQIASALFEGSGSQTKTKIAGIDAIRSDSVQNMNNVGQIHAVFTLFKTDSYLYVILVGSQNQYWESYGSDAVDKILASITVDETAATTPAKEDPITLNGNSTQKTASFHLAGGNYRVTWEAKDSSNFGCYYGGTLQSVDASAFVFESVGNEAVTGSAKGSTNIYNLKAGNYYLNMITTCAWSVTISPQ